VCRELQGFPARIIIVDAEQRHKACWYARRTADLPADLGSHTIVDGYLLYCAHPMYWPVVRYEFDVRNCESCDVFKPSARAVKVVLPE
jgi:hypothetical protein